MTLDEFRQQWNDGSDFIVAHTSGSTGKPKEILLPKSDMRVSARATNKFFGLGAESVYVCPLSLSYIAGKMMAVRAWGAGAEPIMLEPSNSPKLPDGAVDLLAIVPSQIEAMVSAGDCARIRNVLVGGAPMTTEQRRMLAYSGIGAYESYGMTETCSHVALRQLGDQCFKAMPGVEFATDGRGCLIVNLPHYTVKSLTTNDVVRLHTPTSFEWLGRWDNVINSGGIKLYPEQIEAEISRLCPEIGAFYITDTEDPKWGRAVAMVLEGTDEEAARITLIIKEGMDGLKRPRLIKTVRKLARTYNGKIIRKRIGEL